jgi:hypothetical protein
MSVSAPLKDKRVYTPPLRYAEPVAATCPDFLSGRTRLPNSVVVLM